MLGAGLGVQGAQAVRRAALGEQALGAGARHGQARRQADAGRARGRRAAAALGRAGGRGAQALRQAARARSLCAQAGPAGPGWGFVHYDSVFLARFDSIVS